MINVQRINFIFVGNRSAYFFVITICINWYSGCDANYVHIFRLSLVKFRFFLHFKFIPIKILCIPIKSVPEYGNLNNTAFNKKFKLEFICFGTYSCWNKIGNEASTGRIKQ